MAELTTKTGTMLADEAKAIFGDPDQVQATNADWLRWINNGQREIVAVNPILQSSATHDIVSGQRGYSYPADRVQYIQQVFVDGLPIDYYSYAEAQAYILKTGNGSETGTPLIWYEWAQTITLWPTPSKTIVNGLQMDYVRIPSELVSLANTLDLPDRYYQNLLDYVLARVHELNENIDMASLKRQDFNDGLGRLSEQENKHHIGAYPTITILPDDAW